MNTNQIDTRIEETFIDPIWQVADNKAWLYSIAYEVSELLDGSMHLLDLGDFCFADHIGEPARDVALDICQNDMLASSYLIQKEGMNNAVYLPDKPKRPRKSTKQRLATMQKDLSLTSPDLDCNDLPGPRVPYKPLKSVGVTVGLNFKPASKLLHTKGLMLSTCCSFLTDGYSCLRISAIKPPTLLKKMLQEATGKSCPDVSEVWNDAIWQATHRATPVETFQGSQYETVVLTFTSPEGFKSIYLNRKKFEFLRITLKAKQFVAFTESTPLVFLDKGGAPVGLLCPLTPGSFKSR